MRAVVKAGVIELLHTSYSHLNILANYAVAIYKYYYQYLSLQSYSVTIQTENSNYNSQTIKKYFLYSSTILYLSHALAIMG